MISRKLFLRAFPQVKEVVMAGADLAVVVLRADAIFGIAQSCTGCAVARAFARAAGTGFVWIANTTAYAVFGTVAVQYSLSEAARRIVRQTDRLTKAERAKFQSTTIIFRAISESNKPAQRRARAAAHPSKSHRVKRAHEAWLGGWRS